MLTGDPPHTGCFGAADHHEDRDRGGGAGHADAEGRAPERGGGAGARPWRSCRRTGSTAPKPSPRRWRIRRLPRRPHPEPLLPGASDRPWWRDPRIVATAAAGVAAGAVLASTLARSERAGVPVEYDVGLPDTAGMMTVSQDVGFAVSPAGDFVVYETGRHGRSELWYRSLLDATVRRIPGTDDGSQPVISPDGRRIAFFQLTDGGWTVEVLPVEGGTSTTIGRGVGVLRRLLWSTGGADPGHRQRRRCGPLARSGAGTGLVGPDPVLRGSSR